MLSGVYTSTIRSSQRSSWSVAFIVASVCYATLIGCGIARSQEGNVLTKCGRSEPTSKASAATNASSLKFAGTEPGETSEQRVPGLGYLDIESTTAAGAKVSRRCTMLLRPSGNETNKVIVQTSGHCLFEPGSQEYMNAQYTLQIFDRGGYFPVNISSDELKLLGDFARGLTLFLPVLPKRMQDRWNHAFTDDMIHACQSGTVEFRSNLNQSTKSIACFAKNETRSFVVELHPKPKDAKKLNEIIYNIRNELSKILENLPVSERKIVELRLFAARLDVKLDYNAKNLAYLLNERHCSTAAADLPQDDIGFKETQVLCQERQNIIPLIRNILGSRYPTYQKIVEGELRDFKALKSLHSQLFLCRFNSIEDLQSKGINDLKNVCEVEKLGREVWVKWIAPGPENFLATRFPPQKRFGFNRESVFSLSTHAFLTRADLNSTETSKGSPTLFRISEPEVTINPQGFNKMAFMFAFEPGKSNLFLNKTDSGSTLNLFGLIPFATLTTLDGEPTSGGTSILPLPPAPEDDYPSVTIKQICK